MRSRGLLILGAMAAMLISAAPVAAATGGGSGGVIITVNPTGSVSSGTATISGTIACSPLWTSAPIQVFGDASLTQPVGRLHAVNGDAQINLTINDCSAPTAWQETVVPFNGRYAAGTAYVQVSVFGCDQVGNCDQGALTAVIKLRAH